ncbi:MAG: PorP/SprF family type IX secretion system membrane protein [Gloeobacteraceae cyanobacterium ES-bin-316]|nr:PorP/SprF family type IX secretion system membrane protein [Ferruginibacter sp.]
MKTILTYLAISIFFLQPARLQAQDIHFSQMFETPLLRNPALAGIFSGDIRIQSVYRSQYNSVANAYQTTSANIEYKMPLGKSDDFVTVGGQLLYDKAGTVEMTATHVLPTVNYHKSLSAERNMYLSLGAMGGWVQRRVDRSKITTNSQFDGSNYNPSLASGENFRNAAYSYFDGTVGMSFNSEIGVEPENNMYLGIAYHHFNQAKAVNFYTDSKVEMTPKWVASAGVRMNTTDYHYFTIEADYTSQGTYSEILGGVLFSTKLESPDEPKYILHAGAYIRFKDAIIPVAKIDMKPLSLALSYDVNISGLKDVSRGRGGFEISIAYQKFLDRDNSVKNAVRCPRF